MKKSSTLILLLLLAVTAQAQLWGSLSGSLPGDSTYSVIGSIWVLRGNSLIIGAGAIIIFIAGVQFDIYGYIDAAGTENDSIKFISLSGVPWGGLNFNNAVPDSSRLEYCFITSATSSGIYCSSSNLVISNCTICGNTALNGGGICIENYSSPLIYNCIISGNTASYYGGGIFCDHSTPEISSCTISGNIATGAISHGGGIYCNLSHPVISNCAIIGNTSDYDGGGIISGFSFLDLYNCIISENIAGDEGGGYQCNNSHPQISNCVFSGNTAGSSGGGIGSHFYSMVLDSCVISGNIAGEDGGGINNHTNLTISNSSICGNVADGDGGGIFNFETNATIINCSIEGNTASFGGGLYFWWSSALISKSIINNNYALLAGAIYFHISPDSISNCTISRNTAEITIGGIYNYYSVSSIYNTIIEGNDPYGICFDASPGNISYNDFFNNPSGNIFNPPAGVGIITATNANGDSCDIFHNIFLDPLFYSTTGDSAFYLTANSPCIDAGYPALPLDPDSTIADIGAFYFDQTQMPVIENLILIIEGDDIILQWSPFTSAIFYNIYRSETPYFNITGMTPAASVILPEYVDENALGNGVSFYKVTTVTNTEY